MTAVRITNTRGETPPQPPTRPDGRPYRFELIADTTRIYADEPGDLVGGLIDGYDELVSPVERGQARIRYAVGVQVAVQAGLVNAYGLHGCSEAERAVLLGDRDQAPQLQTWQAPVPLVLVASFYEPVRPTPRPQEQPPGEIWWIDPADDVTFLRDLHRLNVITLNRAATPAPPDNRKEAH